MQRLLSLEPRSLELIAVPNYDATGGTLCRYFNSSRGCWFGDDCRFVHDTVHLSDGISKSKIPRCRFYRTQSGCKFGNLCCYRHDDDETNVKNEKEDLSDQMNCLSLHGKKYKLENLEEEEPSECVQLGEGAEHGVQREQHDIGGSVYVYYEDDDSDEYEEGEEENYHEDYNDEQEEEEEDCGSKLDKWMFEKKVRTKPDINTSSCGECGAKFLGADAFEMLRSHYMESFLTFNYTHLKFLTTDARFNEPTLCIICDKFFAKSRDLLRHTVDKTKRTDKEGEEHMMVLEKGLAEPFCYRDTVDDDDVRLTEELCLSLLNSPISESDDEDFSFFLKFGLNHAGGLFGYGDSDDDDDDYGGGMFGFTRDECDELLCQGVKPWDSDAEDVLAALNGWDY